MTRIKVKLDDVEGGFEIYPDGPYPIKINEKSKVGSSKDGNPKIEWHGEILDGDYVGKFVVWSTSLLPQALWVLKDMLEACGFEWDEDGFEVEDLFGEEVGLNLVTSEWDGKPNNKVDSFFQV